MNADYQAGEDARMSKKILDLARDQQEEIARELGEDQWEDDEDEDEKAGPSVRGRPAMESDDEDDELDEGSMSGGEEYAELVSRGRMFPLCVWNVS